jgi:ribosomal protein S27E
MSTETQVSCPQCGSKGVGFEPTSGQLKCRYCGWQKGIPQTAEQVQELAYETYLHINSNQLVALAPEALEVTCTGCGAKTEFVPPQVAGDCPFCGTHLSSPPQTASPMLMPNGILPFALDRNRAYVGMQTWLGRNWFCPNDLKKLAQREGMQGVYLPFWTYDAYTVSFYRGERGEYYYVTETYYETNEDGEREQKTREVRKTRWYPASGRVSRSFDDVLIPGSKSVKYDYLKQLEPWHYEGKLKAYEPSYLAGYKVERFQTDLKAGFELAKEEMEQVIRGDVRRDIGGDEQRIHSLSTDYSSVTFKHLLLPIWIGSYRYRNKSYQVLVNARTGEVLGDRPLSIWKITLTVVLSVLLIGGIVWFVQTQENPSPDQPVPVQEP